MSTARDKQPDSFLVNSNDRYLGNGCGHMLSKGFFCTYGALKYGAMLTRLRLGSRLFLYVNGFGVFAEGIVTDEWNGTENTPPKLTYGQDVTEYSVTVRWTKKIATTTQAVSLAALRECGQRFFAAGVVPLRQEVAEAISARFAAKTMKKSKQKAKR